MPFNGRFVANIILFAGESGGKVPELLEITGLSLEALSEEGRKIENPVYNRIIERAVAQTGDAFLGLHAGEYMNLSAAGLVLQVMQNSPTLRDAMQFACDFANLGCASMPLTMVQDGEFTRLELNPVPVWVEQSAEAVRHTADGVIAFTLREIRALTRRTPVPVRVNYSWPVTRGVRELERVFDSPLQLDAEKTGIVLRDSDLDQPVTSHDAGLFQVLVAHAEDRLKALHAKEGFAGVVKRALHNLAQPEFPALEQVAANLNMSERSLQRRLTSEGQSFRNLLEEVRREYAFAYLRKPDLQIGEVAYMLGYAEPAVFTRAFRRWTGATPAAWREANHN